MEAGDLATIIRTRAEVDIFLEQTTTALRVLTGKKAAPDPKTFLFEAYDAETAAILLSLFKTDQGSLIDFLRNQEQTVAAWPALRLHVPIRPTERLINRVSSFLNEATGQMVMVDYVYEPAILAGMVVEWQGRYLDYSLQQKIKRVVNQIDWQRWIRNIT